MARGNKIYSGAALHKMHFMHGVIVPMPALGRSYKITYLVRFKKNVRPYSEAKEKVLEKNFYCSVKIGTILV